MIKKLNLLQIICINMDDLAKVYSLYSKIYSYDLYH